MAEPAKATQPPAVAPPVPAPVAPVAEKPKSESKFAKAFAELMTATFWFAVGVGFIFLGILFHFKTLIPVVFKPVFDQFFPRLPYLFTGLGLCALAHTRSLLMGEYAAAARKNRQYIHAWKIPLIGAQVFMLYVAGIYAVAIGLGKAQPVQNLMGMIVFLLIFLLYLLWYVIAQFYNRFPSMAGLRVSFLSLLLAALSYFIWSIGQAVLISVLVGLFALISAVVSLAMPVKDEVQRAQWSKLLCLLFAMAFLAFVGYNAWPLGQPRTDLVELSLATNEWDLRGELSSLAYSSNGQKIGFSLKEDGKYLLQVIAPESKDMRIFKVPAGEEEIHPIFIKQGEDEDWNDIEYVLIDPAKGESRGIWKVNANDGSVKVLKGSGVEPFGNGLCWSKKTGELLYVTRSGVRYQLNLLKASTGKSKVLYTSPDPIHSPAWTASGQVAYTDGVHGLPYLLSIPSKSVTALMSDDERNEESDKLLSQTPPQAVFPSPDGFRYLYLVQKDKVAQLWTVLADGTKREKLYEVNGTLGNITWLPDGQKIVFSEKSSRSGFMNAIEGTKILDANPATNDPNYGIAENLILPQFPNHAPAVSPDGVKVAFVSSKGLWYPSFGNGIWVAVLR